MYCCGTTELQQLEGRRIVCILLHLIHLYFPFLKRCFFLFLFNGIFFLYSIPANMRPWVYCTGLRYGTAADFDFFWNRYLQEDLASEQVVMLQNAGCTSDEPSLRKFLDAIVSKEDLVRPQDFTTSLNNAVSKNEYNTLRVFEWLKDNVNQAAEA